MHREKGRSTHLDLRVEAMYILLCNIFYAWKHNTKPLLWEEVRLALAYSWSTGIVGEVGRQVQVQKNSFSPASLAFLFFYRGNQAIKVKDRLEGEAELWNHSLRVVYNVVKVRVVYNSRVVYRVVYNVGSFLRFALCWWTAWMHLWIS